MSETDDETRSDARYTVDLNGTRYRLNEDARRSVQERASYEFDRNEMFSCWWKVASSDQYSDDAWDENVHEVGDPVLVIETEGRMVPWEMLDELNVEMQDADPSDSMGGNGSADTQNSGGGMQTVDPNDAVGDDAEKVIGRTHFEHSPKKYEDVPSPDGEEEDKVPPAPTEMPDHPVMVKWIPEYPEIEHTWAAGEALTPTRSWVEWNVQQYANQPRPDGGDDKHDHWEALLQNFECETLGEIGVSQSVPSEGTDTVEEDDVDDIGPKANGDNWAI